MLNRVLVPVDFSAAAANAVRYAIGFAQQIGCKNLEFVHVYMPQVDSEYPNFIPPTTEFSRFREEQLSEFLDAIPEIRETEGLNIKREVWLGFPADELLKHSLNYDAIIMGTTGEQSVLDRLFGSVSSAVAQRAGCPVVLIPASAAFEPIHQILYGSKMIAAEPQMMQKLLVFNTVLNAHLHFVYVNTGEDHQTEAEKEAIFASLHQHGEPAFSFDITEIEGKTVAVALNEYVLENKIDLVVLATKKRSLLEDIFHKSQTRQLLRVATLPLMVLHDAE
jgi:nucleotide-binding universal stress UspA family protein